jgi:hypothetical protein
LGQDGEFAIAVNEVCRQVQVQQTPKRFAGHWAGNDIAPYYNLINVRLTNILKDGVQRGEISVNIIQRCDTHIGLSNPKTFLVF